MQNRWICLAWMLAIACVAGSCKKDSESRNEITIEIRKPVAGQSVSPGNLEVEIYLEADQLVHEVRTRLYPTNNQGDLILDKEEHLHRQSGTLRYEGISLFTYPGGTSFTLKVEVCRDNACSQEKEERTISFSI